MKHLLSLLSLLLLCSPVLGQAWVDFPASPLATFHVSTAGTGAGGSVDDPMSLSAAVAAANAGDIFILTGGDYGSGIDLTRNGTDANPIVWKCKEGERCQIDYIECSATDQVLWGWEITWDPTLSLQSQSGVHPTSGCDRIQVINMTSHDVPTNCFSNWDQGEDNIWYGNIGWNCDPTDLVTPSNNYAHCFYGQQTATTAVEEYLVSNMCVDSNEHEELSFNFHLFGTLANIEGMHLENNISINGNNRWGTSASGAQEVYNIFQENWFEGGWSTQGAPTLVNIQDNYFANPGVSGNVVGFQINQAWCLDTGSGNPTRPTENIVQDNTFAGNGDMKVFQWECACYNNSVEATGRPNGCALNTNTTWDNNTYRTSGTTVNVEYSYDDHTNGELHAIANWITNTAASGHARDASSTVTTSSLPDDFIVVDPNEYEPGVRCHVFIANWSGAANQNVDLTTCLSVGTPYLVQHVNKTGDRGVFGPPEVAGTYAGGTVSFPTNSQTILGYRVEKNYDTGGRGPLKKSRGRGRR